MNKLVTILLLVFIFSMCNELSVESEIERALKDLDYKYNSEQFQTAFTDDIVKLGRVLFYDEILSDNLQVSCASCHKQEFSFGDSTAFSEGFLGGLTTSNSLSLVNNHFNKQFFWDGRTSTIQWAVTAPIFNELEMGLSFSDFTKRVRGARHYDELFQNAFGDAQVTRELLSEALAQFVGSMILSNSKFDKYMRGEIELSDQEKSGLRTFESNCESCHRVSLDGFYKGTVDLLTDIGLPTIGPDSIPPTPIYYTSRGSTIRIRVPSLRNLSSTAPYMHDGRFKTLQEVIEHYDTGVTTENRSAGSVNSDLLFSNGRARKLGLSEEKKMNLEFFLLTLNDDSIIDDVRFSDPFVR